ncbi:hypothetical protein K469DRAFT_109098 [Zopfia rhizophila CBS 207.26]|uniref:Uncharacterized protein n=1 Tax=Zopfia rhizophila CBS 207.26 TaxID=1314779 RepID=A0A6A6E7T0_9PEZI|nr:hypothetical protein K469DRAFT_109098 [Zopfia rhizophila CBS 207.26]
MTNRSQLTPVVPPRHILGQQGWMLSARSAQASQAEGKRAQVEDRPAAGCLHAQPGRKLQNILANVCRISAQGDAAGLLSAPTVSHTGRSKRRDAISTAHFTPSLSSHCVVTMRVLCLMLDVVQIEWAFLPLSRVVHSSKTPVQICYMPGRCIGFVIAASKLPSCKFGGRGDPLWPVLLPVAV